MLADFDRAWFQRNGEAWVARYRDAEEIRAKLAELDVKPDDQLTREECWQRAAWRERQGFDALPDYRAYAAAYPDDPDAELAIGRLLLDRDDAAGLAHIERAARHFNLALAACNAAYAYLLRHGDRAQAEAWLRRGEAQLDLENAARAERASVTPKDELLSADLPPERLTQLARQLENLGGAKHAWICRKAVKILPEEAVYVLAFQAKGWFPKEAKLTENLARNLNGPGLTFIVMKGGKAGKLAKRVMKVGERVM